MDLGEAKLFLNSTMLTPEGAALNELTGHGYVKIDSNTTWVSPVTGVIYVSAISAGGDGAAAVSVTAGGGGAAGNFVYRYPIKVKWGDSISCTVGTGSTIFGSHINLAKGTNAVGKDGGRGGFGSGPAGVATSSTNRVDAGLGSGGAGGSDSATRYLGTAGGNGIAVNGISGSCGGSAVRISTTYGSGGGGAGIPYIFVKTFKGSYTDGAGGAGGLGENNSSYNGQNGADYGAGGGGGGASGGNSGNGGTGGKGVIIIEW